MQPSYCRSRENRLLPEDWHSANDRIWSGTDAAIKTAGAVRHEAIATRNKIHTESVLAADISTDQLFDRAHEIHRLRDDLQDHLNQVKKEIGWMEEAKTLAEEECEARVGPIEVALQCLTLRERRREVDLVKDRPEIECLFVYEQIGLHDEVNILQRSRASLEKLVLDAIETITELNSQKDKLSADLKDKEDALLVDRTQASLQPAHTDVSFKTDPLTATMVEHLCRQPPFTGLLCPSDWLEKSTKLMHESIDAIRKAQDLRGKISVGIQNAKVSDSHAQTTTDFALRRRHHEVLRVHDNLVIQRSTLLEEVKYVENEIEQLEKILANTGLLLKRVQTRLEERKFRPSLDRVAGESHEALCREHQQLLDGRTMLRNKLANTRISLHELQQRLRIVDHDIGIKTVALDIENQVKGVREQLVSPQRALSLTEQNLCVTGSILPRSAAILR